jgi:tetratricopeptide (TPR) repeat protein
MAVSCHVAFGHYLRTLRERRGLALEEVWSLSQTFPESLNKGYLSRCENGKQKLALPKVVAMSRIYEVPSDVLVERLELDLELENIGGPPTEKLSWAQLREAGKNATNHGHLWAAYAFFRDATLKADSADLDANRYRDKSEQNVNGFMNCATIASSLGKNQLALHEFTHAETIDCGLDTSTLIAERLSTVYSNLQNPTLAQKYAGLALERLGASEDSPFEPFVYSIQGILRVRAGQQFEAIPWFQKTYDSFRARKMTRESASALLGLADCYHETGNLRAASRTLGVLGDLCNKHSMPRYEALCLTLQGLIDQDENRATPAEIKLRSARDIAKTLNDRKLRFQVEFYLFKHAVTQGRKDVARSIKRRLERLALSVPGNTEQLVDFKVLKDKV